MGRTKGAKNKPLGAKDAKGVKPIDSFFPPVRQLQVFHVMTTPPRSGIGVMFRVKIPLSRLVVALTRLVDLR